MIGFFVGLAVGVMFIGGIFLAVAALAHLDETRRRRSRREFLDKRTGFSSEPELPPDGSVVPIRRKKKE